MPAASPPYSMLPGLFTAPAVNQISASTPVVNGRPDVDLGQGQQGDRFIARPFKADRFLLVERDDVVEILTIYESDGITACLPKSDAVHLE